MLIEEWMTRQVTSVKPLDSLRHARQIMEEHRINQLPVVVNGKLVGILTDRDVRDATPSVFDFNAYGEPQKGRTVSDPAKITVESVMSANVLTLGPKDTIFAAADLIRGRRIGAVPIVEGEHVVGILTRSDLLRALLALGQRVEAPRNQP
jgi:acetoin utilization protein AcuB